jgi:hypothetical protein
MGTPKIIIQIVTPLLSLLLYILIISNISKEAAAFTSKANHHYTTTNNKNAQQQQEVSSTIRLRQSSATTATAATLEEEIAIQQQQCQRVTENIIVQEVELNQQIEDNSTILFAARILQQQQQQQQQDEYDGSDDVIPKCEGLLLQKCNRDDNDVQRYQAHITCHDNNNNISTNATTTSSNNLDHFLSIFHTLLIQYLVIENDLYVNQLSLRNGGDSNGNDDVSLTSSSTLSISFGSEHDDSINSATVEELRLQLGQIGFSFDNGSSSSNNNNDGIQMDLSKYEPHLNNFILRHRGTEQGNTSLILHKMLCARRMSFQFTPRSDNEDDDVGGNNNSGGDGGRRRNVISYQPSILSSSVVDEVNDILNVVKNRQWLSTNPDSVDGLPSLHLNLITGGKPLFGEDDESVMTTKEEQSQDDDDDLTTFPKCINSLVKVLRPHLYDTLLPAARRLLNSTTVEISDVFIRSYGVQQGQRGELEKNGITEDDNEEEEEDRTSKTRFGLSPHFDVTAYATCVMALDTIASSGQQGLYTIPPTNGFHTSSAVLKKFFPLHKGDGVVHTFDVLHGVDVDPQLNQPRTSLIVWFTDSGSGDGVSDAHDDEDDASTNVNQPWLLNPNKDDDIGQFVLALASERTVEEDGSHVNLKNAVNPLQLYISSATRGNVFAMTALGQMCDDGLVPDSQCDVIRNALLDLNSANPFLQKNDNDDKEEASSIRCKALANALWYHAAIEGGHRVAQVSLADNLMLQYMTEKSDMTEDDKEGMILMASVLLTMALNQGYNSLEMLHRIRDVECSRLNELGVDIPSDEFFQSAVIQVLLLSM